MSDDFLLSLPSGPGGFGADAADLPSFTPPPQAAPDSFEKDLDNVALDVQFLTLDDIFPPSPSEFAYTMQSRRDPATSEYSSMTCSTSDYSAPFDFGPPPGLTSSTESIYTTQSSEDPATSEYSSMTYSTSSYPALPLDDFVSQLDAVDPKLTMFSDPSPFFDSSGLQLSPPPSSPDVYVFEAQSDNGSYPPPIGISPQILSATFQSPTPPYPTDSPVRAASAKGSRTGPIRTNEVCSQCGRVLTSGRKSNMKAHMKTHDPNRERPFVCREIDCEHPFFTRSNDLKRHMVSQHGDRAK